MGYLITLDKEREFRYGMRAVSRIEDKFKKPITQVDLNALTMKDASILVWAGLVWEDKNLTSDRVMDLIDEYSNVTEVLAIAGEALQSAFGSKENVDGEDGKN